MLKNLRESDGLTTEEVKILDRLHIKNLSHNQLEELKQEATFIFARRNDCSQYNFDCLSNMVTQDNPLASIHSDFSDAKKSHFFFGIAIIKNNEKVDTEMKFQIFGINFH